MTAHGAAAARRVTLPLMVALLMITGVAINLQFNDWLAGVATFYPNGEAGTPPRVSHWAMNLMLLAIAVMMLGPALLVKNFGHPKESNGGVKPPSDEP